MVWAGVYLAWGLSDDQLDGGDVDPVCCECPPHTIIGGLFDGS